MLEFVYASLACAKCVGALSSKQQPEEKREEEDDAKRHQNGKR